MHGAEKPGWGHHTFVQKLWPCLRLPAWALCGTDGHTPCSSPASTFFPRMLWPCLRPPAASDRLVCKAASLWAVHSRLTQKLSCFCSVLGLFVCLFVRVLLLLRQGLSIQPWLSWDLLRKTRLCLNSQRSFCLCLPSAGIKGVYYQHPAIKK